MKRLVGTERDIVLAVVRLVLGIVFLMHGLQLALGLFGGRGFSHTVAAFQSTGIPAPLAALAILAQFLGGIGLIVGFLARIAAFGIAIDMIVAIFKVHFAGGFFMNWSGQQKLEGYEYHLLALALCLIVLAKGAGAASIDLALSDTKSLR